MISNSAGRFDLACALALPASIAQAQTADPQGPRSGPAHEVTTREFSTAKQLVSSVMVNGKVFANFNAGDIAIDPPRQLNCPASPAGKCTLEVTLNVGVADIDVTHGAFWVCTKIDGVYPPGSTCPFMGETRSTDVGNANVYNVRHITFFHGEIAPGNRRVQALVKLEKKSSIGRYFIAYRMYK
jgi:hypothetical protein